jgi:hypothetical protein
MASGLPQGSREPQTSHTKWKVRSVEAQLSYVLSISIRHLGTKLKHISLQKLKKVSIFSVHHVGKRGAMGGRSVGREENQFFSGFLTASVRTGKSATRS